MSDNYRFDIAGAPLASALKLATLFHQKVTGWRVDKEGKRLILFWADSKRATPLPAPLEGEAIAAFVQAWIDSLDYGSEPDVDEVGRGVHVYNEAWGHVAHEWAAFVAIEPYWLMYGK